jgi:L-cysteine:1D-myo-inositol 2-amino-2-deoxy-alpha-D-glucopyranoside ligase
MRLYDTRTGETDEFFAGRTVRVYVCGITPYSASHLGHAFTYTVFDVLVRALEHVGHRVRYVRNITDVDDDILGKARELEVDHRKLAHDELARFDASASRLGLRPPDAAPFASATVPAIIRAVDGLVRRGVAYDCGDGRVYFDVGQAGQFGQLSRLDRDAMLAQFAEKGGDPEAAGKRDPLDFLLWQPSAADEPAWEAPWGAGRPGWHIECSSMIGEELGSVIDIHGGGTDLVFPHHEAEILQAEHLTGQAPFARFWLHTAMVGMDGAKMAKSSGNLVFVDELLDRYEPGALRRYLLAHHYRKEWSYAEAELGEAASGFQRWRRAAGRGSGTDETHRRLVQAFHDALADDLDTPRAVEVLDEAAEAGAGATLRQLSGLLGFSL